MPPLLTKSAEGQSGLARNSKGVLTVRAASRRPKVDSAIDSERGQPRAPLFAALDGLDFASSAVLNRASPKQLAQARQYFEWANADSPAWEE